MKLLLVTNDRGVFQAVKGQLAERFTIERCRSKRQSLEKIHESDYAIIILDLDLLDDECLAVCRELRRAQIGTAILILTTHIDLGIKLKILNCGADAYIVKPLHKEELQARVHALARRSQYTYTPDIQKIRGLVVDIVKRTVSYGDAFIQLRRKEFDLLEYLLVNRGRTVSRQMIVNAVWNANKAHAYNTVDVHIRNLRAKIDRPFDIPLIRTVHGIGYTIDQEP